VPCLEQAITGLPAPVLTWTSRLREEQPPLESAEVAGEGRQRLRRLGSRRVWVGSQWYWDLKPDYRRGELFRVW